MAAPRQALAALLLALSCLAPAEAANIIINPVVLPDLTKLKLDDLKLSWNTLSAATTRSQRVVLLATQFLQASAANQRNSQVNYTKGIISLWDSFLASDSKKYNLYKTLTGTAKTNRLKVFATNLQTICNININNTNRQAGWWARTNGYVDLSDTEFNSQVLMKDAKFADKLPRLPTNLKDVVKLNTSIILFFGVNHTANGWDSPVKSQGGCGSCWAMSVASAVESRFMMHTNTQYSAANQLHRLSPQHLVDCVISTVKNSAGTYYSSNGCDGGWSDQAFDFVYKYNLTTESRYAYTGVQGICDRTANAAIPAGSYRKLNTSPGWIQVPPNNRTALMRAVRYTPTVFYMRSESTASGWRWYGGGVFDTACTGTKLNHAMVLTGYWIPLLSSSPSYWMVKNSWGTDWGEQGYARLKMTDGSGICGSQQYAYYPRHV